MSVTRRKADCDVEVFVANYGEVNFGFEAKEAVFYFLHQHHAVFFS